jgi:hypothetical protein
MRGPFLTLGMVTTVLFSATASRAQLNPPNDMGVTIGHMHLNVHDVEAAKKFYLQLGGTAIKSGPFEGVKYPGAIFQRPIPAGVWKAQRSITLAFW